MQTLGVWNTVADLQQEIVARAHEVRRLEREIELLRQARDLLAEGQLEDDQGVSVPRLLKLVV